MFEPCERETIISTNDEDKVWEIYTRQKKIMNLLKKKGYEPVKVELEGDEVIAAEYVIDLSKISFKKAISSVSEEERQRRSERMKNIRKKN